MTDAADRLSSLAQCSECTPFRDDREAWLAAVHDCPRCSGVLNAFEPGPWTARDEDEGERLDYLEHFDPAILPEIEEAPALAAELLTGEQAEQLNRAERSPRFHHWGLVQQLLAESVQLRNRRPRVSTARAKLAVTLAESLDPDRYHPAWVADLNAKALAHLARAERRMGRFREAERSMIRAGLWAVRGTNGGRARSFLGDLTASNRLERRDTPPTERPDEHDKMAPCPPLSSSRPRRVPEA